MLCFLDCLRNCFSLRFTETGSFQVFGSTQCVYSKKRSFYSPEDLYFLYVNPNIKPVEKKQKKTGPPAEANDPVSKKFKLNAQVLKPETLQLETVGHGNFNVSHAVAVGRPASLSMCLRTVADFQGSRSNHCVVAKFHS